ncbi:MAG: glycosyl hydrolase family 28 protein [Candidatus Azobacteroides sp.]|nr:glycosyl hydrolase family 28 protein [Candidatus Azobacteroides sp.]
MKHFVFLVFVFFIASVSAKEYNASLFGIKSNGTTLNTRSIQKAIDYIHENGGGTLVFYVGRYLTGSVHLKSNVNIQLNRGAVIVGSTNPYDYDEYMNWQALFIAHDVENISIRGSGGVIDGQGREVAYNIIDQVHKAILEDSLKYDRTDKRPCLIYFRECNHVTIEGIIMKNAASWVQTYDQCSNLIINDISVNSNAFWNNDALDIVDCINVVVTNSYFNTSDDAICLKSHDAGKICENIEIRNCVARSGASGVKFGTATKGGFRNVRLSNIKVYDTFRSAFTVQAVDGGIAENISIDSLYSYNTGNVIYLRIGDRRSEGRRSSMNGITITNVYAEVPEGKPDSGYEYEGPVEDLPRNISPCAIVGLPGQDITDVTLKNITIVFPGGGNPHYAKVGLSDKELNAIPEMPGAYPEFSQFKELPAWGFYIRHAAQITFKNVNLTAQKPDYRPAIVTDDVKDITLTGMKYNEPGKNKNQVFTYKSKNIQINK